MKRSKKFRVKDKVKCDLPEESVLVELKNLLEAQLFKEWLEDRGMESFIEYVNEVYGLGYTQ